MPSSTTLTVRIAPKVKDQLGRLAKRTSRTKSFLASEAIADYVARELAIIDGVGRGLEDVKAGRLVSHEDAMARLEATIAKAAKRRR
ncbi:MAG: CopG family transcriptional regulator [Proteobacteria bacterium]|nr:CopG family transcriptional regulator [Pseudomonadota bacterium]